MMRTIRPALLLALSLLAASPVSRLYADDSWTRMELNRTDLTGAPGMEVISSIVEIKPGGEAERHLHHGVESGYVLQGAMIQRPGKEPEMLETGTPLLILRNVPHGGFKVVGDKSLKLFLVHVVDKDKPLYEYVK